MGSDFRSGKPCRRDANDFERMILHHQARADSGTVSAEFSLPEPVTQHDCGRRTATQIILAAKQASGGWGDPKRGKKVPGDSQDVCAVRPLAPADAQPCVSAIPGEYARKRPLVLADRLKQRIAEIVLMLRDAEAADAGA